MNECQGCGRQQRWTIDALAKLNLLHLLKELYSFVHIPRSVYDETVTEGMRQGYEDARTLYFFLNQMGWKPEDVDPAKFPPDLAAAHLDRGERDTLALALDLGNALVLMDEAIGRRTARACGLTTHGTLGVMIQAYQRDLISEDQLRLYFAELARRHDIWINRALAECLLRDALEE